MENSEKTKVIKCRRGEGKWKKVIWKWKGREIEKVRKFKYLGYTLMTNGGQKKHVRDKVRKKAMMMREV